MLKIKATQRYKIYALLFVGFMMISAVSTLGFFFLTEFNKSQNLWSQYIEKETVIDEILTDMKQNLGYGGFIHNFKNLILRRDLNRYQTAIETNLWELNTQIGKLQQILTARDSQIAIAQLQETFGEYEAKYEITKRMIAAGKSSAEIDAVVKVEDKEAISAMNILSKSIQSRLQQQEQLITIQNEKIRNTLKIIIISFITFIVPLMFMLVFYLLKISQFNEKLILENIRAEEASLAKSRFISSMSHELRTPLNSVLGFAQLIELDAKDDITTENTKEILHAGNHLLDLINQILELSHIESGTLSLSIENHNLNDLISDCISTLRPMADTSHIALKNNMDPAQIITIKVDGFRFKQIILNLLSNAIKYNRANGTVTIECSPKNNKMIRLSITDTGYGLTEEQQSHLFKAFDRAGAENLDISGTGLGLVISKDLIELMDGTIGFESIINQGSRFWVEIPVANNS